MNDNTSETTSPSVPENSKITGSPDVDELEDRLRDLQGAMDQLQSGDLDAAERAIEALEARVDTLRD